MSYYRRIADGFANIEQGFWGFALKFVFMNIPWVVAPVLSIPYLVKQLTNLIRKTALQAAAATNGNPTKRLADANR